MLIKLLNETWKLLEEMSPFLLLGFLFAGILKVMIPRDKIYRHLSGANFFSVLKASLFGVPLPLCSCGVIPVAAHIEKEGASKGSTVSFLISTPTTGVDSILATYALLGPLFAIIRPISAFFAGVFGGTLLNRFKGKNSRRVKKEEFSCTVCDIKSIHTHSVFEKIIEVFKYGFYELVEDTGKWIIMGVLIGGIISALIPDGLVNKFLSRQIFSYPAMMLIGIPMYVCATGSIPIAASLIAKGMTPGAGLVFLFTGPATNSATLTFVLGKLGKKSFFIYLFSIIFSSLIFGILLDYLWKFYGFNFTSITGNKMLPYYVKITSAIILVFLILRTFRIHRKEAEDMKSYYVPDMKCNHCVKTIEKAFHNAGVEEVSIDLKNKRVFVGEAEDDERVIKEIEKAGYIVKNGKEEKDG